MNRLSAIALVLLVAGSASAAEKKFDRTFTVSPGGSLTVDADSASVYVSGADTNQVTVHMSARGSDKDLAETAFDAAQSGSGVNVTLRRGQKSGWFNWRSWSGEQRIDVTVPKRYAIKVRTGGGGIELKNTVGPVDLRTSGGDVEARNVTGTVELRTSGGAIIADSIRGDLDADTSGGDVRVIHIDGKIKANTSGGNVRCSLVGANREISATTSGGDIELILPRGTTGNVEASTSGGDVKSELPVTASTIKEGRLEGTLNGGGPSIYAHTSGGSIALRSEN
ncbi:MAG TPA: DUF4097 family beta strand repeat-containing protein [Steroidobacteraceae bacterium]|nr:DUF4097 family beta strand repeat-containing protein [Steroidobacteraceae bacterium]